MKKWQISWDVPEEEPPGLLPLPLGDPLLFGEAEFVRLGEPVGVLDRVLGFDPEFGLEMLAKGAAGPMCSYGQFAPREHIPLSLQSKQIPSFFFWFESFDLSLLLLRCPLLGAGAVDREDVVV